MDTQGEAAVVEFSAYRAPHRAPHSDRPEPEPLWRQLAGQVLRSERVERGWTLMQVAARAGVSPQYLSEVERGRKDPSSEMLESICGALGLRLADLLSASGRVLLRSRLQVDSRHRFPGSTPVLVTSLMVA